MREQLRRDPHGAEDARISLGGLDPEQALCALLKIDPVEARAMSASRGKSRIARGESQEQQIGAGLALLAG